MQSGTSRTRLNADSAERFGALRRELGVTSFGLNQIVLQPGQRGRIHRHHHQEEVYLILEGQLSIVIEGEETELGEGELIRVAPNLRRQLVNRGPGRLVLLALGAAGDHQGRDGEAFTSWAQDVGAPPQEVPLPPDVGPEPPYLRKVERLAVERNRHLMENVFAALANGDGRPFLDALSDDARWTVVGSSPWSRTYEGKQAIIDELMRPLFRQFADRYTAHATRIVAEDDVVVVEARGQATTKSGEPYHQTYCYVFRLRDEKVCELTEYNDTELVKQALSTPGGSPERRPSPPSSEVD